MQPVYGYLAEGIRHECGDKVGFLEANIALALKNPEFSQKLREYLKSLKV
jgi:UTP--glucose-1-phosphate uridylyltransferase